MEYSKIQALPTASAKQHEVEQQLSNVQYASITDALSNIGRGGEYVLELLAEEQQSAFRGGAELRTWKIEALCDTWGTAYKPGDVVSWEVKKSIRVRGKKLDNRQIKDMERRGEHSKLYDVHSYTVGADGCIECGYGDAAYLLNQFGVHYETGIAVTSRREKSREPITRRDGTKATLHFWRFKEVPPGYEKAAPVIETETKPEPPKPKRGRKPKAKIEAKTEATEQPLAGDLEDGK